MKIVTASTGKIIFAAPTPLQNIVNIDYADMELRLLAQTEGRIVRSKQAQQVCIVRCMLKEVPDEQDQL